MHRDIRRREFLKNVGAGVIGGTLGPSLLRAAGSPYGAGRVGTIEDLRKRRLGRIGVDVPLLSLGTAPMGHAFYRSEPFAEVVEAAIDAGIRFIDTARIYDVAEGHLAPILARRRKDLFLATKAWSKTKDETLRSLARSLEAMRVDEVDLCHMHNAGQFTREEALGKDGLLAGLLEARRRGWIRHIGCSGHLVPERFVPVIETGEIDMIMVAMNFVDCHTYNFEERVLPTARKHDCAIVAMKVYGGVPSVWGGYRKREPGRLAGDEYRQWAIDYALSIPDVATMVVGLKSLEELRAAIEAVRRHRPLEGERRDRILARGAELAAEWGPRFGPVTA